MQEYGIIPADAGSTIAKQWRGTGTRDHPRGCGEHLMDYEPLSILTGSSPRMRGARQRPRKGHARVGITPADAGSTVYVKAW